MSTTKVSPMVIRPEYIDQYGHVNYKVIPSLLESFQDQFLSEVGMSFDLIEKKYGLRSVVRRMEIEWKGQIKLGDSCFVSTSIELRNTSLIFHQVIDARGLVVVFYTMIVVLVDEDFLKSPIPDELRQLLS